MWCSHPHHGVVVDDTPNNSNTNIPPSTKGSNSNYCVDNNDHFDLTKIMARTSPPVLHRFIDELSFWETKKNNNKRKTNSSSTAAAAASSSSRSEHQLRIMERMRQQRYQQQQQSSTMMTASNRSSGLGDFGDNGEGDDDDDTATCYSADCDANSTASSLRTDDRSMPPPSTSSSSSSLLSCVWKTAIDKTTGKPYYYDSVTRRTQWDKPEELRRYERMKRKERKRITRQFFDEMESNILKALDRGEIIPGIPRQETPLEGPPQEPLPNRKPRVRTISGMDDVLLAELRDDYNNVTAHRQQVVLTNGQGQVPLNNSNNSHRQAPTTAASKLSGAGELQQQQLQPKQQSSSGIVVGAAGRPPLPRPSSSKNHGVTFFQSSDNSSSSTSKSSMVTTPQDNTSKVTADADNAAAGAGDHDKHPLLKQTQHAGVDSAVETPTLDHSHHQLAGESLVETPTINADRKSRTSSRDSSSSSNRTTAARGGGDPQHVRSNTEMVVPVHTLMNPDIQATIRCVCAIIRAHILQASAKSPSASSSSSCRTEYLVFKDDYGSQTPRANKVQPVPTLEEVISFYEAFYKRSQMEHDTIITSLIYLERVIKLTDGVLAPDPENWHSLLFSCMVLASKVWDDLSMWNIDFSNVSANTEGLSSFTLRRINQLEIELLKVLKFDVKVPASEYAKYYFLLRSMLIKSGLADDFCSKPVTPKIESLTTASSPVSCESNNKRRGKSLDDATFSTALALEQLRASS